MLCPQLLQGKFRWGHSSFPALIQCQLLEGSKDQCRLLWESCCCLWRCGHIFLLPQSLSQEPNHRFFGKFHLIFSTISTLQKGVSVTCWLAHCPAAKVGGGSLLSGLSVLDIKNTQKKLHDIFLEQGLDIHRKCGAGVALILGNHW